MHTEISLLKTMNHKNVIKMKEIIVSKPSKRNQHRGSTFLVFEYMDHDFAGLFRHRVSFSLPEIKCIMIQILEGVRYLHQNKILHRDIKSANLLFNSKGEVKLADFGLGRKFRPDNNYTSKVVTLWYRAPELLLGARKYSDKVDMWSVGCIFVELFTCEVFIKKEAEYSQIQRIFQICGGVEENEYHQAKAYPHYNDFVRPGRVYPIQHAEYLRKYNNSLMDDRAIEFLSALLNINPQKRLSADEALKHPFLTQYSPAACRLQDIKRLDKEYHEMYKEPKPLENSSLQINSSEMSFSRTASAVNKSNLPNLQLKSNHSSTNYGTQKNANTYNASIKPNDSKSPRRFADDRQQPYYLSTSYNQQGREVSKYYKKDQRSRTPERRRSHERKDRPERMQRRSRSNQRRERDPRSRDRSREPRDRSRERRNYYDDRYRERRDNPPYRYEDESSRRYKEDRYESARQNRKREDYDQVRKHPRRYSSSKSRERDNIEERRKHYK